ncbi:2'-5' RNA ligase family protein [Mucilaginibacter limnophilus]|uniref:2'-5' RNA ligase family protein n=2 Tax=Mucilaginibacter limnophilus TaxID=1932778 RepID=A0A437MTL1_9SPHI|nr:2'-5' RNA ligase family protein [Mucilaginibacter limnophilus]
MKQKPLILTLRLDAESQAFFGGLRQRYFPRERNHLEAHLTLFHQLPEEAATRQYLEELRQKAFELQVTCLRHLGVGVAYVLQCDRLFALHRELSARFRAALIAQDRYPFRPYITVQNKVSPEVSKALLAELSQSFRPFTVAATGMDLWEYLGGPWKHTGFYKFNELKDELDLSEV